MVFITCTMLYNHHHYLIPEDFHHPPKKLHTHQSLPIPSSFQPLATTDLLSVSMDLPILDVASKRNHTIHGLLCPAPFTEHNIFRIRTSFLFWLNTGCIARIYHSLFIHSSVDGHLVCFHFLAIMKNTAMNILEDVFVWMTVFNSLGYIPRSGTAGSW